jgi:sensor c-di-GMP phosphodiesterase-like protein
MRPRRTVTRIPKRTGFIAVSIALAFAATLVPVLLGVYLAHRDANRREHAQVQALADAAVTRLEAVRQQAVDAVSEMEMLPQARCSSAHLVQIRRIAFAYRYIHDAGIYGSGRYLCSALLGVARNRQLLLRPADWRDEDGFDIWFDVDNPFGANRKTLLFGRKGNYVSIDPEAYVDVDDLSVRALAAVNTENGRVFAATPGVDRAQMERAWQLGGKMADVNCIFVVRQSRLLPLAVVVKAPRSHLLADWRALLTVWLLAGLAFGLVLGGLVYRALSHRFSTPGELQGAVRRREFVAHYQPIIALASGQCIGAEALVRWRRRGRLVRPDLFIPFAEQAGLIQQITDQVLELIVTEMGAYLRHRPDFYISINVSAEDLKTRRFLEVLTARLADTGIAPRQIRIEATERGFMDADTSRETIRAFRAAGHPVYIDDFGTGYSSLSYLQSFKVDVLKIDKSFVDTIGQDAASSNVAPHIIAMAHALGLEIVAEGIEHEAQAAYLLEHGTQFGQGWLFAKAMPASELRRYLARE